MLEHKIQGLKHTQTRTHKQSWTYTQYFRKKLNPRDSKFSQHKFSVYWNANYRWLLMQWIPGIHCHFMFDFLYTEFLWNGIETPYGTDSFLTNMPHLNHFSLNMFQIKKLIYTYRNTSTIEITVDRNTWLDTAVLRILFLFKPKLLQQRQVSKNIHLFYPIKVAYCEEYK